VPFAEGHDPLQALGLGGLNKPLGKGVQIWRISACSARNSMKIGA
jgi:hypothetical protein